MVTHPLGDHAWSFLTFGFWEQVLLRYWRPWIVWTVNVTLVRGNSLELEMETLWEWDISALNLERKHSQAGQPEKETLWVWTVIVGLQLERNHRD